MSNKEKRIPTLDGTGMSGNELYSVWYGMMSRCYDPKSSNYRRYGARGISVHLPWHCAKVFIEEFGPRPSKDLQIDRINNDGNYEPGNVRWATRNQNMRNQSITNMVQYNGEKRPRQDVAELLGMNMGTLRYRIIRGERDPFRPVRQGTHNRKDGLGKPPHKPQAIDGIWTVARFPNGNYGSGGRRDDPDYQGCEIWEIQADSREEALKKAKQKRKWAKEKAEMKHLHAYSRQRARRAAKAASHNTQGEKNV